MLHHAIATAVIDVARRLHQQGMLAACDGNISVRVGDDRLLVTPAGRSKALLTPEELVEVDLTGRVVGGHGRASTELPLHLAVYAAAPAARAVVHAHPPHAIAWTLVHPFDVALPTEALPEVVLATGGIPIAPYAPPGTTALGDAAKTHAARSRVVILARHGALAWGEDLGEAEAGIERLEHAARILHLARQLGPLVPLDAAELARLHAKRAGAGPRVL